VARAHQIGDSTAALNHQSNSLLILVRPPMAVEDFLKNPDLLKGKSPAEIEALLGKTPGWRIETLGKGGHAGQGWVLRRNTRRSEIRQSAGCDPK
jgi:hypothetical protein